MCGLTLADKEAAIAGFRREYPRAAAARVGHPALRGCDEIAWGDIPCCPAEIPVLLRGLLDQDAAPEADRVLTNALMDGVFRMGRAMPKALPFLLRLAACPEVPSRAALLDLIVVVADFSQAVDPDHEIAVRMLGSDSECPEREQCRDVFAEHADHVRILLEDEELAKGLDDAERASLRQLAGLH